MSEVVKANIVFEQKDSYDGYEANLIELDAIQELAPNVYVIKTKEKLPVEEAGNTLPLSSIQQMVERKITKLSPILRKYI